MQEITLEVEPEDEEENNKEGPGLTSDLTTVNFRSVDSVRPNFCSGPWPVRR